MPLKIKNGKGKGEEKIKFHAEKLCLKHLKSGLFMTVIRSCLKCYSCPWMLQKNIFDQMEVV